MLDNPLVRRHLRRWMRRGWWSAGALTVVFLLHMVFAESANHGLLTTLNLNFHQFRWLAASMLVPLLLLPIIPLILATTQLIPAINGTHMDELMLTNMSPGEIVHGLWTTLWVRSTGWLIGLCVLWWLLFAPSFVLNQYHTGPTITSILIYIPLILLSQPYICSILVLSAIRYRRRHLFLLDSGFQLYIMQPIVFMALIGLFVIALIVLAIPLLTLVLIVMSLIEPQLKYAIRSFIFDLFMPLFALTYFLVLLYWLTCYKLDESREYCVPQEWLIETDMLGNLTSSPPRPFSLDPRP